MPRRPSPAAGALRRTRAARRARSRYAVARLRVLVFLLLSATAHMLTARWLLAVSPRARAERRLVHRAAAALALALPLLRLVGLVFPGRAIDAALAVAMVEVFVLLLALVPLGVLSLVARGGARVVEALSPAPTEEESAARVSRREAIERIGGTAVVSATSAVLGWGIVRGRHAFELEEVAIAIRGWPRALDGYVIAQVSDIHVGAFVGDRELDEGFEVLRRARADLVVVTGDLVDFQAEAISKLLARLLGAGARDGAYVVLGNHDHYAGAADVASLIGASDVRLLHNEGVRIRPGDGGGFSLLGVDDLQGRHGRSPGYAGPDLGRAYAGLPPDLPRVLLAHQPRYFHESQGRVALQLSGHTHGGQINPGFSPAAALMEFVAGRYDRAGSTLWVNRGFGVVGPPARIGAPPEVTKLVIVAA